MLAQFSRSVFEQLRCHFPAALEHLVGNFGLSRIPPGSLGVTPKRPGEVFDHSSRVSGFRHSRPLSRAMRVMSRGRGRVPGVVADCPARRPGPGVPADLQEGRPAEPLRAPAAQRGAEGLALRPRGSQPARPAGLVLHAWEFSWRQLWAVSAWGRSGGSLGARAAEHPSRSRPSSIGVRLSPGAPRGRGFLTKALFFGGGPGTPTRLPREKTLLRHRSSSKSEPPATSLSVSPGCQFDWGTR